MWIFCLDKSMRAWLDMVVEESRIRTKVKHMFTHTARCLLELYSDRRSRPRSRRPGSGRLALATRQVVWRWMRRTLAALGLPGSRPA